MMSSRRHARLVAVAAAMVTGVVVVELPLQILEDAHGSDDVVEGFFPAGCAGDLPPGELLALADWPLDEKGIGCRAHPGVLDAPGAVAAVGGRPRTISAALAEYVLSLDNGSLADAPGPVPSRVPAGPARSAGDPAAGEVVAGDPAAAGGSKTGAPPAAGGAATFAVSPPAMPLSTPLAALGEDPSSAPRGAVVEDGRGERGQRLGAGTSLQGGTARPEPLLFSGALIGDETLDELRGGFEVAGGLKLSFGIERVVFVNGVLASTTTLTIADLDRFAGAGLAPALPVGADVAVIQIGPNNSFDASALASGAFATVIQNTLDDQSISTVTTINAQVNSAALLQANRLEESLRGAVSGALLR